MTRIIIEGLDSPVDLIGALAAVARVFTEPSAYAEESHWFGKRPIDEPPETGARPEHDWGNPSDPFLPCPQRGTHTDLRQCWMCWSDVHRGAVVETDVLAPSWDSALVRLLEREGNL